MPSAVRGTGFGLRLALYTIGAVAGPLAAIALMRLSGDDFRLVFWIALHPRLCFDRGPAGRRQRARRLAATTDGGCRSGEPIWRSSRAPFWWAIGIAGIFSLARFSPAFLVLKTHDIGVDAAFVPIILVVMYLVYSAAAYPFGILADRIDRHLQLALGAAILDQRRRRSGQREHHLGGRTGRCAVGAADGDHTRPACRRQSPTPRPSGCAAPPSDSSTSPSAWRPSRPAPAPA